MIYEYVYDAVDLNLSICRPQRLYFGSSVMCKLKIHLLMNVYNIDLDKVFQRQI